ncbi:dehydrogenase [Klebsiella michiganensis]|nr:dehydrogenase [Klebsiella sp. FDAARGOS_511]MBF8461139.1 dehydrogenase [Klebsiella michiganensis]MBZ7661146.1 dehydrogenase [Klebsiella grimontii]NMD77651.1 dehydrogenase [Klebsiella sp. DNRA6]NRE86205.1 dehydrogenase [Klebsiella michiganensis]
MGSGIGSLSVSQRLTTTGGFTIATAPQIATAWPQDNRQKRTIFIVD